MNIHICDVCHHNPNDYVTFLTNEPLLTKLKLLESGADARALKKKEYFLPILRRIRGVV